MSFCKTFEVMERLKNAPPKPPVLSLIGTDEGDRQEALARVVRLIRGPALRIRNLVRMAWGRTSQN